MVKIFRNRLIRLGRDEEGVALVVTLAAFFFLYLFCAGVFAIGNAVKERIHLQNAVDAAAYSAAVVQADAISRIATINRAMSWTYAQMTKRQMDYIVCKWLKHTVAHYNQDKESAQNQGSPGQHKHPYWYIGDGSLVSLAFYYDRDCVRLNQRSEALSKIKRSCEAFENGHLGNSSIWNSMYAFNPNHIERGSLDLLRQQIEMDRQTIRDMNAALERLSDERMGIRIKNAARDILRANVPSYMAGQCDYIVQASDNPRNDYFRVMTGNEEPQFLAWGHTETIRRHFTDASQVPSRTFNTGSQTWFPLKNLNTPGIQRSYDSRYESAANTLVTSWRWWTVRWTCTWTPPVMQGNIILRDGYWTCVWSPTGRCEHGPGRSWNAKVCEDCNNGTCDHCIVEGGSLRVKRAELRASHLEDTYYNNDSSTCARAMPLMLTRNYFGRRGSITVGIVRHNGNPWRMVPVETSGGIYSAFNPFNDTWCFASAKAGYRLYDVQSDWERDLNGKALAFNGPRDYCIDWKAPVASRSEMIEQEPIYNAFGRIIGWRDAYETLYDATTGAYYRRLRRVRVTDLWRQSWNLTQHDWDAVMIPVRQEDSTATEGKNVESHLDWMRRVRSEMGKQNGSFAYMYQPVWIGRGDGCLRNIVQSGNWEPLDGGPSVVLTTDVISGEPDGNGRWRIENNGKRLDWGRITRVMYH